MEPECKVDFLTWYQANKITADRIINDLKKQSFEAVMHLYAYTAKSLKLEHIETSAKLIVQNLLISSYFCTFIV